MSPESSNVCLIYVAAKENGGHTISPKSLPGHSFDELAYPPKCLDEGLGPEIAYAV
jgi:hypothetical protein